MAKRIFGDVSDKHAEEFLLIRGILGLKASAQVLEAIIDIASPIVRKQLKPKR